MVAALVGCRHQGLQAHADAEERSVRGDVLAERLNEVALAQVPHSVGGRADAGQDHHVGVVERRGHGGDLGPGTDTLNGAHDRAQVARVVIQDHDVEFTQAVHAVEFVKVNHDDSRLPARSVRPYTRF